MRIPAPAKAALFGATAVSYFTLAGPALGLSVLWPTGGRRALNRLVSAHARFCLLFMGVKAQIKGDIPKDGGMLVVANHLSYVDVLVMGAVMPASFVTSVEVRDTPFLGQIARLAGCLFVERRSRENLSREVAGISRELELGGRVVIFPEATSTDGSSVLRFRRPLFQAAVDAGVEVLPLCLNYRAVSGVPVTGENRDAVCWYGDMDFGPHLWGVFQQSSVELEIEVLHPINARERGEASALAEASHQAVSSAFRPLGAAAPA